MPEGRLKSRRFRRVKKKLPGGKTVIHYIKRKPSSASCSNCGKKLPGVPRVTKARLKKIPKNQRRPERPYGGNLCSKCSKEKIKKEARV
jgi:large subunit ribosomal protein L34e